MRKIDRTLRREFDRQDRHEFTIEMISDTGKLLVLRGRREQSRAIHLGLLTAGLEATTATLAPCQPHCRAHHTLSPADSPKVFLLTGRGYFSLLLCCALPPQAYQPSASGLPVFRQMSSPLAVPA